MKRPGKDDGGLRSCGPPFMFLVDGGVRSEQPIGADTYGTLLAAFDERWPVLDGHSTALEPAMYGDKLKIRLRRLGVSEDRLPVGPLGQKRCYEVMCHGAHA